ncbi:ADQ_G0052120.mRNA.1.CDS.1 [Saccharomyces cerevisiae]|nr:ADQ_G0052120.mRNA.1.CDS.1 [Saccharomyces cerevisiae]CAI5328485.1 CMF_HP2_G0047790.mRNA.1.CDS.1 [Saccharomyces cerevisiae]CAI6758470.1 CMF_HP2_G0047790.mRNA.1.CDS.1 [Saccharomyces cerevisiae]CAI6811131.1 CMF_HP1_G0053790.mRNA.1.CDS.1 [Saccharomyces cerevisiae]CAI6893449.1 ADQ_G0052120.mRNA.1.CDS.1 [Saccharomyces cerevisiae]
MSTLFLIGIHEIEKSQTIVQNEHYFDRVIELQDLDSLMVALYKDRVSPFPNVHNFETGVSIVLYDPSKFQLSVRQLDVLFKRFFPSFNISAIDHTREENLQRLECVERENSICRNRITRINHWMYHHHDDTPDGINKNSYGTVNGNSVPTQACEANIYTLLLHLNDSKAQHLRKASVPRLIRNIEFMSFLSDPIEKISQEGSHYWNILSTWDFCALSLSTQELIWCGFTLIKKLSKDAKVLIADNKLLLLLFTLESSYHQVNKFHNFRHAIDVMQATWRLCTYLLKDNPVQTLLLCMAAIGHDVGHPGTNNQLLCNCESEVAQNFKNVSILENFHRELFQQLLSEHWPQLLSISKKKFDFISEAILATDMALHSQYEDRLMHENPMKQITLISLIIKAADISNVTRTLSVSARWAYLITLEFNDCALLETFHKAHRPEQDCFGDSYKNVDSPKEDLESIQNILVNVTDPDDIIKDHPHIPNGQIFFINTFAEVFFNALSQKFSGLKFLSDNVKINKEYWMKHKKPQ